MIDGTRGSIARYQSKMKMKSWKKCLKDGKDCLCGKTFDFLQKNSFQMVFYILNIEEKVMKFSNL